MRHLGVALFQRLDMRCMAKFQAMADQFLEVQHPPLLMSFHASALNQIADYVPIAVQVKEPLESCPLNANVPPFESEAEYICCGVV